MKYAKKIIPLCLLAAFFSFAKAQTKTIDNLKKNIALAGSAQAKLNAILLLCEQGYSLHPDTLMEYAENAYSLATGLNNKDLQAAALYQKCSALTNKGLLDSALAVADSCQDILEKEINNPILLANIFNQKGRCYVRKNQYKEAIGMGYKTIELGEKNKDALLQVKGKTLIGWAYLEMGQFREAVNWHLKALRSTADTVLLQKYAIPFANLAATYDNLGMQDSGFYYINKGISYARKYENLVNLSNSLAIEAGLYINVGQPQKAEPLLKEAVAIRKQIGDPFYTASDLAQLSFYYAHYGEPEKGIAACNEGIALAKEYHLDTKLFFLYNALADNYRAMNNMGEYSKVLEEIITIKDSVYAENSSRALADLNAKYELQKKENTIMQQRLDIVSTTYWMYGIIALLVFGSILWYINYKNNRRKQEQKMTLALMEEKRIAEKAIVAAQELERKRIAADLHDNLGAYAAAISANVDNITSGKSNGEHNVYEELKNNSQSIVSQLNDTIWVLSKEQLALTSISDRLKVFIQKMNKSYPQVQIDVKESIETDRMLAPIQALHLFKILQEAIINALKHSGCSNILITIESNGEWKITIEDNGSGIPEKPGPTTGGNGLYNMKNRSRDAGWNISWQKNEPHGTKVILHPTTN